MPFQFTCPHCGATTQVDDQYAGQAGSCFQCSKSIELPEDVSRHADLAARVLEQNRRNSFSRFAGSTLMVLLAISILGGTIFMLVNTIGSRIGLLGEDERTLTSKNMTRIWLAMDQYHDDFGAYPPAIVYDDAGKPMHSWRVLILPYLGEVALYQTYDFSEPWDGPNNSSLHLMMPRVFVSGSEPTKDFVNESSFQLISGGNTLFPLDKTRSKSEVRDGLSNTILMVETICDGTNWLAPTSLNLPTMSFQINESYGTEIGSHSEDGAHIITADGKVYFVKEETPPRILESMATIDLGERVTPSSLVTQ